jgi:hypothetical protein
MKECDNSNIHEKCYFPYEIGTWFFVQYLVNSGLENFQICSAQSYTCHLLINVLVRNAIPKAPPNHNTEGQARNSRSTDLELLVRLDMPRFYI